MTKRHWREIVEIVGVVAIVASLLLLAAEVRQSNRIAAAQAEFQLSDAYNQLNLQRATDAAFAKLFPKMESPAGHLVTATETSQMRGIAWHWTNIMWSVNSAYENGLLSREIRDFYVADFAYMLQDTPGIRSHFVAIYEDLGPMQSAAVFTPIAAYVVAEADNESP